MKKYLLLLTSISLPTFVYAKGLNSATRFVTQLSLALNKRLIPFLVLLALAYFLFGVFMYIGENESSKREEKKQKMFWGLVALFIMLSVWSLVFVIANTFNIDTTSANSSFYDTWKNS